MLDERYPHLAFLLNLTGEDLHRWRESLDLEEVEVLYIYGVDGGRYYPLIQDWLHERPERDVIFLEDDLEEIRKIEKSDFLKDPQAHLFFLKELDLRTLARHFPVKQIAVVPTSRYAKEKARRFHQISLELKRKTSLENAFLLEELFSHLLFRNFLPNFRRLPQAFFGSQLKGAFQGVPALICGAGPSLISSIPHLAKVKDRALIFAGGSAIAALSTQGILPHLGIAIDPNEEEYERLRAGAAFQVPLFYAHRVLPSIFGTLNGPSGYLRTLSSSVTELWMEEKLGLNSDPIGAGFGEEAFSVTTISIAYAQFLGCNPIIFTGIDLAYTGQQSYAPGVLADSSMSMNDRKKDRRAGEQLLKRKGKDGKSVHTAVKWIMEAESIARYVRQHPETQFFDCTLNGIEIPGLDSCPLADILQLHCQKSCDLKGALHLEIEEGRSNISADLIETHLQELEKSLQRTLILIDELLHALKTSPSLENGRLVILQSDLAEEIAWLLLLKGVPSALSRLIERRLRSHTPYEREVAKWQEIRQRLDHYAQTFTSSYTGAACCGECAD